MSEAPSQSAKMSEQDTGKKSIRWGLESPDELIGSQIDNRFTILERIARGGMGTVFKALQAPMGRVCAVKVLSATYEGKKDPAFDKRFFREAATISRLRHPNTVTLYDYGNNGALYYMVMEFVDGRTLFTEIYRDGPLEERRTRRIAMQICRSLREAHEYGIVHRDLKPENVLLVDQARETDLVKVLDFGLAKVLEGELADDDVTETGLCMGSPRHMAPEQITGDTISAHTDIYALGILLYEMLTARSPFDRPTRYQTLVAQVHEDPAPFQTAAPHVNVSPEMESLVMRCLRKERHHRYASMNALLQALKELELAFRASIAASRPSIISSIPSPLPVGQLRYVQPPQVEVELRHSLYPPPFNKAPPTARDTVPESIPPIPPLPQIKASKGRSPALLITLAVLMIVGASALGSWLWIEHRKAKSILEASTALVGVSSAFDPKELIALDSSEVAERVVSVESIPPGARVIFRGQEVCDKTPCKVRWKEPVRAQVNELQIVHPGYVAIVHSVAPHDEKILVKLTAVGRGRPTQADPPADLANDTGYKYSPY